MVPAKGGELVPNAILILTALIVVGAYAPEAVIIKIWFVMGAIVIPVPPEVIGSEPLTSLVRLTADQLGLPAALPCKTVVVVP